MGKKAIEQSGANPTKQPKPAKLKRENTPKTAPEDPDSMFKVGFLAEVYQERPVGSEGVEKVITRCNLEQNHSHQLVFGLRLICLLNQSPTRAQRFSTHWPQQSHRHKFWIRKAPWW